MFGFEGPVEADECYIGGKAANMQAKRREQLGIKRDRFQGTTSPAASPAPNSVPTSTMFCDASTASSCLGAGRTCKSSTTGQPPVTYEKANS